VARLWLFGAPQPQPDDPEPCTGLCQGVAGATCTWVVARNDSRSRETVTGPCPRCNGSGVDPK